MQVQVPEAFEALFKPKRIKVFFGGRGSGKSQAMAIAAIVAAMNGKRILCAREFQNSIEDSVHNLIARKGEEMGAALEVQQAAIFSPSGGSFRFVGLARNIESIKSKDGFDICWVEEAETVSNASLDVLTPTIRAEGSELWYSFNPRDETSAVYQRYVAPYMDEVRKHGYFENEWLYVAKVSYRDNPWFPDVLQQEMEIERERNYKKYLHIWEGELNADYKDALIEPEWVDAAIDAHKKLRIEPIGERVLAFDPADCGTDAKAIVARHGCVVQMAKQWSDGDIAVAISRAFGMAHDYRADCIVYDSVGIGAAVKVGLEDRIANSRMQVDGFGGGDGVDYPDVEYNGNRANRHTFRNKRAQYWWLLRDRFEKTYRAVVKGEYIDPAELISLSSDMEDLPQLKSELVRVCRKRQSGSDLIQIVSKEDMRRDGQKSPNLADALVMAFANPDRDTQQITQVTVPTIRNYW